MANFSLCFKIAHLEKKTVTVTNWWIQTSFKPVSCIYEVSVWIEFQTKTSKQLPKQERIIFSGNKESFVTSWLHRNKCTCVCMHIHTPQSWLDFTISTGQSKWEKKNGANVKNVRSRSCWTLYFLRVQGYCV